MNDIKISLIIPAYNEEKYIGKCLESALQSSEGRFLEIIVVDNASTDKTFEVASRFPGVRVIREDKKGVTKARQRGLNESKGNFIACIDADTQMHKSWVDEALKILSERKDVVSLSGPYRYYDGTPWMRFWMDTFWWLTAPISYRLAGFMILGGNFVAKKEALIAMGGFDTNIKFYGDDTNTARRLSKFGKVLFKMDFYIHSSCRRFVDQGFFKINGLYALNFIWEAFLHRPFSKDYDDIKTT